MSEKDTKNNDSNDLLERALKGRRVFLSEEVNMKTARRIIEQLFLLEDDDPDKPIYFFINSPGGEINSGMAIYDVMQFIRPQIYTIGCGLVASIASIIYLQPDKEFRYSLPHSEFLLHQPLGGMQGSASDLEIHAKQILKSRSFLNQLIANKSGKDLKTVQESTKRDFWMDVDESIEWGLVNKKILNASELPGYGDKK